MSNVKDDPAQLNEEISNMLVDFVATREKDTPIVFITESRFIDSMKGELYHED